MLRNLTVALTNSGDYHRADSLTRVTLAMSAAGGTDDAGAPSRSVTQLANYAVLRAHLGDLDVADSLGREALDIYRATRSSRQDEVGNAQRNLALIAAARGRHAEGLARFDTVIAWHRAAPTSAPPPEAIAFIELQRARILLGMGRTVEGARAIDDADPVLRRHLPPLHLYRAELEFWQGMSAVARGDAAAAVGRFDSASALCARTPVDAPIRRRARCGHFRGERARGTSARRRSCVANTPVGKRGGELPALRDVGNGRPVARLLEPRRPRALTPREAKAAECVPSRASMSARRPVRRQKLQEPRQGEAS
ncbi:MAG: tetratricopeptide repeat protein [Gemmatimonadetes bacterium]|nr:tetratricopeptide repeat protein [Gemmatimonadota bacterium]